LAAATKITWCMFLPVQLLLVLVGRRAMTLRERMRETLVYAVLPVVLITPWVVRSQLLTGTPVYSFTWRYTGGKYWDEDQDQRCRAFLHDWCTYTHPTLSVAPGRVPRALAGMLRRDWPLSATAGLCAVAALSRVAVGGPVVPLLSAALLNFLVIGGFLTTSLSHLLAVFVLGAVVAGSPFAGGGAGRLGRVGRFGAVFVVLLSVVIGRSGEPWIVPKFVLGPRRGPAAVARQVGLTHPYGECQLWVNNHSPANARVLLLTDWFLQR